MSVARISLHPQQFRPTSISITETHWGYILRRKSAASSVEGVLRFMGIVLVMASYAFWLVPGGLISSEVLLTKIVVASGFAMLGAALYFVAVRGFGSETQIDTAEREVRFARRNGRGETKVMTCIPFGLVESVFVQRDELHPATLCLRPVGNGEVRKMVYGLERELNLVHSRLCKDLKSPEERMEMRLKLVPKPATRGIRIRQVRHA